MNKLSFKRKYVQIDLFGSSVEVLSDDGYEYFFYFLDHENFKSCYVKKKKFKKKKWADPEMIKNYIEKYKIFKFSDENEFGFVLI